VIVELFAEPDLDRLEEFTVNDRGLLSWQHFALERNLTDVKTVAQKVGERTTGELDTADGFAALESSHLGDNVPTRVPAVEIEELVIKAVRESIADTPPTDDRELIASHVKRVEVQADRLTIELKPFEGRQFRSGTNQPRAPAGRGKQKDPLVIDVPWRKTPSKRKREIIVPESASRDGVRPIRAETRVKLISSLAQGRRWLEELVSGKIKDVECIAARERCSVRKVNMTISLALLAPSLVKAAIEGRLPHGIGVVRLSDAPAEWQQQYAEIGLPNP